MPLRHLIVLIVNDHRFPAHSRTRRCMGRGPSGPTAVRPCLRPLRVIGSASRPAAIKATQTNEREITFERSFLVRHRKHRPGVQPEPTSCSGAILPVGWLNPTGERPASRDEPRRRAVRQHRSMAKGRYDRTRAMNPFPEPFTDRTVLAANAAPRSRRQTLAGLWRRSFEIRLLLHDGRENRPPGSRGAKRQTCASCLG